MTGCLHERQPMRRPQLPGAPGQRAAPDRVRPQLDVDRGYSPRRARGQSRVTCAFFARNIVRLYWLAKCCAASAIRCCSSVYSTPSCQSAAGNDARIAVEQARSPEPGRPSVENVCVELERLSPDKIGVGFSLAVAFRERRRLAPGYRLVRIGLTTGRQPNRENSGCKAAHRLPLHVIKDIITYSQWFTTGSRDPQAFRSLRPRRRRRSAAGASRRGWRPRPWPAGRPPSRAGPGSAAAARPAWPPC